jgi:hypothetical protein
MDTEEESSSVNLTRLKDRFLREKVLLQLKIADTAKEQVF